MALIETHFVRKDRIPPRPEGGGLWLAQLVGIYPASKASVRGGDNLSVGARSGAVAPPMPPHLALAPSKPEARFGSAGGERGSSSARPSEGPGGIGASAEGEAHRPPDKMLATRAPIIE
jgi:hypothetical protein